VCRKSNGATLPATVEATDLCVGEENAPERGIVKPVSVVFMPSLAFDDNFRGLGLTVIP